jgi:hypothetical protein
MRTVSYALAEGEPKRLEIESRALWKDCRIFLDGVEIGRIPDQKAVMQGLSYPLPDGSTLTMKLDYKVVFTQFRMERNGVPLPGTMAHPLDQLKSAYILIYIVGGMDLLLGFLAALLHSEMLRGFGFSWLSMIIGAVFLLLGLLTQRRSKAALIIAVILYAIDAWLSLIMLEMIRGYASSSLLVHTLFIIPMILGIGALDKLKKQGEL